MAKPAPASSAANEVVLMPKMSRMASTRINVRPTEMMDFRYWISVASIFLPFSSARPIRPTAMPINQRPTIQAAMAPRIFRPKSAPWVERKIQTASMFIMFLLQFQKKRRCNIGCQPVVCEPMRLRMCATLWLCSPGCGVMTARV